MSLALVTDETRRPERFTAHDGSLYIDGRRVPLQEGYERSRAWFAEALNLHRRGQVEQAMRFRNEALALDDAAREAYRWHIAAGHDDPLAYDRMEGAA